jgi:CheY-like chemotaxis protein
MLSVKNKLKVLLVDDNDDVLEFLHDVLGQSYEVVIAVNGLEALAKFQQDKFDFIVTDVRMPKLSGIELAHEVRKTSQLPILFITASEDEFSEKIQNLTHVYKVKKPFRYQELQDQLKQLHELYFKALSEVA